MHNKYIPSRTKNPKNNKKKSENKTKNCQNTNPILADGAWAQLAINAPGTWSTLSAFRRRDRRRSPRPARWGCGGSDSGWLGVRRARQSATDWPKESVRWHTSSRQCGSAETLSQTPFVRYDTSRTFLHLTEIRIAETGAGTDAPRIFVRCSASFCWSHLVPDRSGYLESSAYWVWERFFRLVKLLHCVFAYQLLT